MALRWPRFGRHRGSGPAQADQVAACLPAGLRMYAIGDVHGRLDCLLALERMIQDDIAQHPVERSVLVQLGDLVDRGPDSRGVLHHLATASDRLERRLLRGNHEEMMMLALTDPGMFERWRGMGGAETLVSYGIDPRTIVRDGMEAAQALFRAALPASHLALLERQETMLLAGDYCFVHAGLRPGIAAEQQDTADLFWIREEFLGFQGSFGQVVIHGHTPVEQPDRRANRINVDTGAYLTGRLTAVALEADTARFIVATPPSVMGRVQ